MKIDVYTSARNPRKHLSVPSGTDLKVMKFPPDLDADLQAVIPFKASLDTDVGPIGLDRNDVESQIKAKGFATHSSSVVIDVFAP
jgi:hypothetical protein